jgi:hypothetical protein
MRTSRSTFVMGVCGRLGQRTLLWNVHLRVLCVLCGDLFQSLIEALDEPDKLSPCRALPK